MTERAITTLAAKPKPYGVRISRGLHIWVYPTGAKIWRFRSRVRGRMESATLGRWPSLRSSAAIEEAGRLETLARRGHSPSETCGRRRMRPGATNPTVRMFAERWLTEIVAKVRKDPEPVKRLLEREVYPWIGGMRLGHVRAEDLRRLVFRKRDSGREAAAGALRHMLKRVFDYAVACELVAANPMLATPLKFVTQHKSRRRTLSAAELRIFAERTRDSRLGPVYGSVLRLILLTLCRKSELLLARWNQIDLERGLWEVPAELSKTGLPHIVYLSHQAVEEFRLLKAFAGRSECVVPMRNGITEPVTGSALNKAMKRIRWGIAHFTPHDLRRTGATILNEQGYDADVIEKALNHAVRGVRGVYNRAQYAEQRKAMLQAWADWLDALTAGAPVEKLA